MSLLLWDIRCRVQDILCAAKAGSKDAPVIERR